MRAMLAITYGAADYFFFVTNVVIVAAYLSIVVTMIFANRILPIVAAIASPVTRFSTIIFFAVAAATRVELAWHAVVQEPYLNLTNPKGVPFHVNVEHLIQAVFAWVFLAFFSRDLVTYKGPKSVRSDE